MHLGEGLAAHLGGLGDGVTGLNRGFDRGRGIVQGDHHRQAVRDDVMHLPGHPGALGRHGHLCAAVPFALGRLRPL